MSEHKAAAARLFFFLSGSILWLGIALSGFEAVHRLLYLPAIAVVLAALTGFCPGLIFSRWVLGSRD